jgi:hypothetical protein
LCIHLNQIQSPEHGDGTFLWNIRTYVYYMVWRPPPCPWPPRNDCQLIEKWA